MKRPVLTFLFLFLTFSTWAKEQPQKSLTVTGVSQRMNSIRDVLKRLLEELAKAKRADEIRRVNCLQEKVNLVKGLLKASEKANIVFLEANYSKDDPTKDSYGRKIEMYGTSAEDVEKSADECAEVQVKAEGTALVYIRPEEPDLVTQDTSPWDGSDGTSGVDNYPVVPPASPFR